MAMMTVLNLLCYVWLFLGLCAASALCYVEQCGLHGRFCLFSVAVDIVAGDTAHGYHRHYKLSSEKPRESVKSLSQASGTRACMPKSFLPSVHGGKQRFRHAPVPEACESDFQWVSSSYRGHSVHGFGNVVAQRSKNRPQLSVNRVTHTNLCTSFTSLTSRATFLPLTV